MKIYANSLIYGINKKHVKGAGRYKYSERLCNNFTLVQKYLC